MSNSLKPLPTEYDKLKEEVAILAHAIAGITAERDDLKFHICRQIKADYDAKIGKYEYELFELNVKICYLKRVCERLQAAINRKEHTTVKEAEEVTNEEFREYEEELHSRAEKIREDEEYAHKRAAQDEKNKKKYSETERSDDQRDGDTASPTKMQPDEELKTLYRKIVKRLHPDMNPDATKEELDMLDRAMKAYAEGDIDTLREIASCIDEGKTMPDEPTKDNYEELVKLKTYLDALFKVIQKDIKKIKASFPYNVKDMLADKDAVKTKVDKLKAEIKECKKTITALNIRIDDLNAKLGN